MTDRRPADRDATPGPAGETSAARALVVDDSRTFRWVLSAALRALGFEVDEAADGFSAVAALRKHPSPAVLVVDLNLPGMSGPELLRAVRIEKTLGGARTVLTTGDVDREGAQRQLARCGADAVLGKPFTHEQLEALLRSLGLELRTGPTRR